ncbi:class I SAM-dependent methyltransferase [Paenibacillus sabuli]|uniref:class I SAM-dependent methyltransferase n=1 Tax=Paenibacillus sabuli TaxID=2772509 RepID=UPI0021DFD6A1|nr:class I SAM-dependent methyltransferase [Paenibacillus sabuli]
MIRRQPDFSPYIHEIQSCEGLDILDLGAGSGRFASALAKQANSLICTDISESMLALLDNNLKALGLPRQEITHSGSYD